MTCLQIQAEYENQKGVGGKYYVAAKTAVKVASFPATAERPKPAVTDAEVEAQYQRDFEAQYKQDQVQASHLLIRCDRDADDATKKAKLEKAQQLLAEVKAGKDFAKLAAENSEDPGSKEKGGALNWFAKGRMVKEFEDAAWALQPGAVSDVVETQFGYHLIKKTGQREVIPLDEVKDAIRSQLEFKKTSDADEAEAKAQYERELAADAARPEAERVYQRKQYHLLDVFVPDAAGASADDKKLNRDKAEALLKEARAKNNFAELAAEHSGEGGLGVKGDLGYVEEKDLPKPFVKDALKLEKGQITEVIEQPEGCHLLQKADERDAIPFDDCRRQLVAKLRQERDTTAKEKAKTAARAFLDEVYAATKGKDLAEVQKQFPEVAAARGLKLVTTLPLGKDDLRIPGLDGYVKRLVDAALALDEARPLTDIVEDVIDTPKTLFVACLQEQVPGREPQLAEVTARVRADLDKGKRTQAAREKAQKARDEVTAELAAGKTLDSLKDKQPFHEFQPTGRGATGDAAIMNAARGLRQGDLALVNSDDGAVLVYLKARLTPDPADFDKDVMTRKFMQNQMTAMRLQLAYEQDLAKRYPFEVDPQWTNFFEPPKRRKPAVE